MSEPAFKLSYTIKETKQFKAGTLVNKTVKFTNFIEAVKASRVLANTHNLVGRPLIEEV